MILTLEADDARLVVTGRAGHAVRGDNDEPGLVVRMILDGCLEDRQPVQLGRETRGEGGHVRTTLLSDEPRGLGSRVGRHDLDIRQFSRR